MSITWGDVGAIFTVLVVGSFIAGAGWQDPEYRAKLSAARKEQCQKPEYRAKLSAARRGKRYTAETKAEISAAVTRRQ